MLMAQPGQVFHGQRCSVRHIHQDGGQPCHGPVDQDERQLAAQSADDVVGQPGADQDHAVHLPGQGPDQFLLDSHVLVGVGHEDLVAADPGVRLGGLDERG